ncbi:MAG: cysteine hydrolase family protein [Planctomycetota bacterium]|jgi:nicotinamidase-related amidase
MIAVWGRKFMVGQDNGKAPECVLVDLNTQGDFLDPAGACRVQNAATLLTSIRRVVAWAKWNRVPVVSSIDSHRNAEARHDGFPMHCVDGSPGQGKIACTLFDSSIRIEGDNTLAVPLDLFQRHQQVIFRKRTHDLLCNPKADRFLTQLPAREFILFGVGLEYSIKALALGLLARSRQLSLVADACGFWSRPEANLSLRLLGAKGVRLVTVDDLLARRIRRRRRYPLCLEEAGDNGNGRRRGNGRRCRDEPSSRKRGRA